MSPVRTPTAPEEQKARALPSEIGPRPVPLFPAETTRAPVAVARSAGSGNQHGLKSARCTVSCCRSMIRLLISGVKLSLVKGAKRNRHWAFETKTILLERPINAGTVCHMARTHAVAVPQASPAHA
jgi:hypothetical protein